MQYLPTTPEDFRSRWMEYEDKPATAVRRILRETKQSAIGTKRQFFNKVELKGSDIIYLL